MPQIVIDALWGLGTIVIIMGGILSGVFTADRVGRGRLHLRVPGHRSSIYRDYKWRELPHLVHRVVKTVAMVMMLIGFSVAFGYMMAHHADPGEDDAVLPRRISDNKYVFLLPRQHPAAAARHVHGPGADAADLHADLHAGDRQARHRSRCTSG